MHLTFNISETVQDRDIIRMVYYRKSCMPETTTTIKNLHAPYLKF